MNNKAIKKQFPILQQNINDKPLVYLDNAATTQKPQSVLDAIQTYYTSTNANVHRGLHTLSQRATEQLEQTRIHIANYINARHNDEIIFTKGTTDGVNLIASTYGKEHITQQDSIVVTAMEHHSNFLPWQQLCKHTGANLHILPLTESGEINLTDLKEVLNTKQVKIVATAHISNTLGTINPIKEITNLAHKEGAITIIDAAQTFTHQTVNVQDIDCDFLVTSGHKMYGPTGIGFLYAKEKHLQNMTPYQFGGEMVQEVTSTDAIWNELSYKFEAGTPNIAGIIGLGAAITFLQQYPPTHNEKQVVEIQDTLQQCGVELLGTSRHKAPIFSFNLPGIHPHDAADILNQEGVAVRAGLHCTEPLFTSFNLPQGSVRASFACYNTLEDTKKLVLGIQKAQQQFKTQ